MSGNDKVCDFWRRISKRVSCLGENSSSCPVSVFVEFKYSVIYGKMFFQQKITDAEVSTLYVCGLLTAGTAIRLPTQPTQPVQLLQANAASFSGKVKRMHAWILHEEKKVIFFHEH